MDEKKESDGGWKNRQMNRETAIWEDRDENREKDAKTDENEQTDKQM